MSKVPWVFREAKWWQFWLPQSGIIGGLIITAIVLLIGSELCHLLTRICNG